MKLELPQWTKKGDGSTAEGRGVVCQKQPGLYAVKYHPIGGTPKIDIFARLYEVIAPMEEVEVRLTPDEGMYVINLTGNEAKKVMEVLNDGACSDFEESVACIGASICQVGVRGFPGLIGGVDSGGERSRSGSRGPASNSHFRLPLLLRDPPDWSHWFSWRRKDD